MLSWRLFVYIGNGENLAEIRSFDFEILYTFSEYLNLNLLTLKY